MNEETEEYPQCERCKDNYIVRDGEEPTKYCDHCAHEMVEKLEAEFERVKRQNAALFRISGIAKVAFNALRDVSEAFGQEWKLYSQFLEEISTAETGDAGRDYLTREQVKPLVEALHGVLEWTDDCHCLTEEDVSKPGGITCPVCYAKDAVAHAKTLGL